jgi:hypothetical protein
MVRAILRQQNPKSCTRRVIKPQPVFLADASPPRWKWKHKHGITEFVDKALKIGLGPERRSCPYGMPGDRLWVRETIQQLCGQTVWHNRVGGILDKERTNTSIKYMADGFERTIIGERPIEYRGLYGQKIPSIHMPRWASRITLEVTDIRAERLQDISEHEAVMEGVEPLGSPNIGWYRDYHQLSGGSLPCARDSFASLWDTINHDRGFGWWVNPWVWAISFKVLQV